MSQPKSSNNLKKITIFVVISNFTAYKTLYEKKIDKNKTKTKNREQSVEKIKKY